MESESLKDFLRDIIAEKAGIELDKDVENQLVSDLYERLENQIYRSLVNELSNQQLDEMQSKDRTAEEILKYIGLTLIFFMVYSCSGGEDILQEGPEEDPFKDYCLVTIEHSGKSFGFLEFTGSKLSGNIQWGDDKSEMFAGKNTPIASFTRMDVMVYF